MRFAFQKDSRAAAGGHKKEKEGWYFFMSPQLIICLVICVITVALYIWGKFPMAVVAMASVAAFLITGCVEPSAVLGYFGNNNGIMIMAMFVVAAGFNKTQFVKNVANGLNSFAKGNLTKIMIGYILVAILLSQFIQSPVVVFGILSPLLAQTVESVGIKPSKVMFPLGVASIATCSAFPLGSGATVAAELNGYLTANEYTQFVVQLTDPMKARLPLVIVCAVYCILIAPRFAPSEPVVAIETKANRGAQAAVNKAQLPQVQEIAAFVIFFGTTVALIFQRQIGLETWVICLIAAVLMVVSGVLSQDEAIAAMPGWMYLLFVGSLAMGGALSSTGAGQIIGDAVASVANSMNNQFLIYLMFFLIPFLMTQVMQNRGVMLIFIPIAIQACKSMGANPVGVIICVQAACLTAFMTPMATAAVPYYMAAGGYDLKSVVKQSAIPAILFCAVSVIWSAIAFPLY